MVQRTINWLKGLRRMRVRYDRLLVAREAWAALAACVICYKLLHDELPAANRFCPNLLGNRSRPGG